MATGKQQEKEPLNVVHQNAIFCETVTKEQRHQKLYTNYGFNPYKKNCVLAGKPNLKQDSEEVGDAEFLATYKKAQDVPQNKYNLPQTEAQEIGWNIEPLVSSVKHDVRLHHPRQSSKITKYMDKAWKQKEQETMH